jgi:hypothetical protein
MWSGTLPRETVKAIRTQDQVNKNNTMEQKVLQKKILLNTLSIKKNRVFGRNFLAGGPAAQ